MCGVVQASCVFCFSRLFASFLKEGVGLLLLLWSDAVPKGELKMLLSISKAGLILSICLSALINISLGKWFLNLLLYFSGNLVWSDWTQSISYLLLTYCLYWFAFLKYLHSPIALTLFRIGHFHLVHPIHDWKNVPEKIICTDVIWMFAIVVLWWLVIEFE